MTPSLFKYDILYIVTNGFAARMITQLNLVGEMKQKGIHVGIISPDKNDKTLKDYCSQHHLDLLEFSSGPSFLKSSYLFYRNYFLEDIDVNHALLEKHYHELYYTKHNNPFKKTLLRFLYIIQIIKKYIPGFRFIYTYFERLFLKSDIAAHFVKSNPAALYVSTYPVNADEALLIHYANKQNLKTVCHLLSWDNITCKGYFINRFDAYLCWGSVMRNEFIEKYKIDKTKLFVTGVPHFDVHRFLHHDPTSVYNSLGLKKDRKYIFFAMSAPRFVPKEIDIVEYLSQEIENNHYGTETDIIIRPHPQNVTGHMADPNWIERLKKIQSDRCLLFMPSLNSDSQLLWSMAMDDMYKLSYALSQSEVCINSCSTVSIDALMCGTGNIAPLFDGNTTLDYWQSAKRLMNYSHVKKFIQLGGTELTLNFKELNECIVQYLNDKDYNIAKRTQALNAECFTSDKKANTLIIETYINLLNKN